MAPSQFPHAWQWKRGWFVPLAAFLFLVFALELFVSARLESPTFDEPAHLYAGYSYWRHGDFGINPEHPPLVKLVASLPLLVDSPPDPAPPPVFFRAASAVGGQQLIRTPGYPNLIGHARIAVSVFAFLLALLVTLAGYEMFGQATALFALALLVFDPFILANGPLVGTDTGATCLIFATIYTFYRYVKRPSLPRLGVCALAAGLALAAKHSAIFIFPMLFLLCVLELILRRGPEAETHPQNPSNAPATSRPAVPDASRGRYALRLAGSLLIIAVVSVGILWAFYGFRYAARPDGHQIIPSPAVYLQGLQPAVAEHTIAFAEHHRLLPEAYLFGLTDVVSLSHHGRVMYVMGKLYPNGRWFYFPMAFLIKSTLAFLLLLALVPFARGLRRRGLRREVFFLLIPPLAYIAVAMGSRLDIGIRHILPIEPFLILLAAAGAIVLARQSRAWAAAVALLLALHIGSSMYAFPNYLPYSNEAFGGVNDTHLWLSDSNVGWEGGLKALHVYLVQRHITQCWFAYSALPDPALYGIPCKPLPTFFSTLVHKDRPPIPTRISGPVFISSQELLGSLWGSPSTNPYRSFIPLHPSHVIAGEILEYDGQFSVPDPAAVSHFALAEVLLRQRNPGRAVTEAQQAVALDPASLYAHETLSSAYAADHRRPDAAREYQTSMHIFQTVDPQFAGDETPPTPPAEPAK